MDEELDAMKPAGMPAEMERWNVEDLQDYIDRMRAEITRVEAIIAGKDSVNAAAAALFGDKP
ncbi:MAG: DUF1192 domain-containing protein [Alphaproteobacteria bacterium]|nr:DUF1192 domain-containing protein [Alphaproteobacteria bacterium]